MPQRCLTKLHTSTPRTHTIFGSMRTAWHSIYCQNLGFHCKKSWCNINTCFYKHLFKHAWRWRQYCTLKTTLSWSWLHFSTSCDHQAVRSAATCFCVLKQSHTQPAQHTGWLPSVEKTALPEIQPKNAVSSTQKQQPLPKGGKKTQQNYFLNNSQEVTETYLAWKSQESLRSPALYVKWSSHTKTWPTKMGNPSAT